LVTECKGDWIESIANGDWHWDTKKIERKTTDWCMKYIVILLMKIANKKINSSDKRNTHLIIFHYEEKITKRLE